MPEFAPIEVPQGPLITPHIPNITGAETPKLYDAGASIVAAAAKGAEINGRVRSMENQLLRLQLSEQNKDIEHGLAVQRMAQQNDQFQQNMFLRDKQVQSLVDERNWKERKYYDALDDQGKYSAALSAIDLSSPDAWNQAMRIKSEHPEGANSPGGRRMEFFIGDQYNKRTAVEKNTAINDQKAIDKTLSTWNWQGFHMTSDPLAHPEWWRPAYQTDDAGNPIKDAQGNLQVIPGQKSYRIGTTQQGQPLYITRPASEVDDLTARYQRNLAAFNKQQVIEPNLGVHPYPVNTAGGMSGANNTRIIEKNGHHFEVDDVNRQVIQQID